MDLNFGRGFLTTIATISFASLANAQDLQTEMTLALERGDNDTALAIANTLYETSVVEKDEAKAGHAAYAKAQIFGLKNMAEKSAKAYKACAKHYWSNQNAAQSLQCQYQSGLTFYESGKHGRARDTLKDAAKKLESIDQERSALAANVYLVLSKATLPGKFDHSKGAASKRIEVVKYLDKGILALETTQQDETNVYLSALYLKGLALEDAEKFPEAAAVYKDVLVASESISATPKDFIKKTSTRYNIARAQSSKKGTSKTLIVDDIHGNEVELKIKKGRTVKTPKLNRNQMVDGASVNAQITLAANGSVKDIEILESIPNPNYGEAFAKAIKTWKFIPPENVSGENIEPFEYGITFSVKRR